MPSPPLASCSFVKILAVACAWLVTGCKPDTDLVGDGTAIPGGPGAAAATLIDPLPGAGAVPLNLAAVLVRFPTAVSIPDGALAVVGAGRSAGVGGPVAAECPAQASAPASGACISLPLAEQLLPSATYTVSLGMGIVDDSGHAIDPGPVGQFATSAEADMTAPLISGLVVQPAGPCVLVTFQTDESASGTVLIRGGDFQRGVSAGAGATTFSVAASVASFGGGTEIQVAARAADLAGNAVETPAVSLTVPTDLLPVAITEVYANAAGPEPAQEYVEIRNLGQTVVSLAGLAVEDAKGADKLPESSLAPGEYALIVPSGFDAQSPVDTAPRVGTPLLRVDARIGSDGLANGGEVVRLRTAARTIISSYGGFVDVSAAKWAGHSVHRVPEDACDQSATWNHLPAAATPGWGAP